MSDGNQSAEIARQPRTAKDDSRELALAPVPPGFNPLEHAPDELKKHGIPRRPDAGSQPCLLRAWLRLFEPPLNFVSPEIIEEDRHVVPPPLPTHAILKSQSRIVSSRNWCGAEIISNSYNEIVQIFGEWRVPTPSLPPLQDDRARPGAKVDYICSTWVGLDGDRRYLASSLPQVGTEQKLSVDVNGDEHRSYRAWFQWWAHRQVKLTFMPISGLHIAAGMSVMALLWAIDPHHVVVIFRTFAPDNQITVFVMRTPEVWLTKPAMIQPRISGATAEWIMERPAALINEDNPPADLFPQYTPFSFRHCVAGTAPRAGLPTSEEVLTAPQLLRMFEMPPDAPSRTRIISTPKWTSTTSLEVRYGGFGGKPLTV